MARHTICENRSCVKFVKDGNSNFFTFDFNNKIKPNNDNLAWIKYNLETI